MGMGVTHLLDLGGVGAWSTCSDGQRCVVMGMMCCDGGKVAGRDSVIRACS